MKPVGGEAPAGVAAVATASASGTRAAARPQGWRKRALTPVSIGRILLVGRVATDPPLAPESVGRVLRCGPGRGSRVAPAAGNVAAGDAPGSMTTPAPWINQRLIRSRWNFRK